VKQNHFVHHGCRLEHKSIAQLRARGEYKTDSRYFHGPMLPRHWFYPAS